MSKDGRPWALRDMEVIIASKWFRTTSLPQWGPFSKIEVINERSIWVEGLLKEDLISLRRRWEFRPVLDSHGISHPFWPLCVIWVMPMALSPNNDGRQNGDLCIRPAVCITKNQMQEQVRKRRIAY